ncbi:MAG: hypothetical protein K2J47_11100 [Ruminococcus sp.]|nr:hypothetical protein [Ruminococcus sp.]
MSLLTDLFETFNFIEKSPKPDGQGGFDINWTEGIEFQAYARLDNSIQSKIAEKLGVTSLYTITTNKNVTLENNDVIKRKSDGKFFRITSNGDDNKTPDGASLNMRQVSAELWVLPHD